MYNVMTQWTIAIFLVGKPWQEKIDAVRGKMKTDNCQLLVVTNLDEIAWLLNLRGSDIKYNPVFFAYVVLTPKDIHLFIDSHRFRLVSWIIRNFFRRNCGGFFTASKVHLCFVPRLEKNVREHLKLDSKGELAVFFTSSAYVATINELPLNTPIHICIHYPPISRSSRLSMRAELRRCFLRDHRSSLRRTDDLPKGRGCGSEKPGERRHAGRWERWRQSVGQRPVLTGASFRF